MDFSAKSYAIAAKFFAQWNEGVRNCFCYIGLDKISTDRGAAELAGLAESGGRGACFSIHAAREARR